MTSGDFPELVISIVPLTRPPTNGMKLLLSGSLPKSSSVPDNCATGAFAFSDVVSLLKSSMILAAT